MLQGFVTRMKPLPCCSTRCLWFCPICLPSATHRLTADPSINFEALWSVFSSSIGYLYHFYLHSFLPFSVRYILYVFFAQDVSGCGVF